MSRLYTCVEVLQLVTLRTALAAPIYLDFAVVSGKRNADEQDAAVRRGASTRLYPTSLHNVEPLSLAVDLMLYEDGSLIQDPGDPRIRELGARMLQEAALLRIPLVWGGLWQHPARVDLPHFQTSKLSIALADEYRVELKLALKAAQARGFAVEAAPAHPIAPKTKTAID